MTRTAETKPLWVKFARRDLAMVEKHDHAAGPCDLPDPFDAFAFTRLTTQPRREFVETDTRGCCCPMGRGVEYPRPHCPW